MSEKDFVRKASFLYMLSSFELTVQSKFNSSQLIQPWVEWFTHLFITGFYLLSCLFFTHPDETLFYLALLICNISFQFFNRFIGFSSY
jgi:hypothetical protein